MVLLLVQDRLSQERGTCGSCQCCLVGSLLFGQACSCTCLCLSRLAVMPAYFRASVQPMVAAPLEMHVLAAHLCMVVVNSHSRTRPRKTSSSRWGWQGQQSRQQQRPVGRKQLAHATAQPSLAVSSAGLAPSLSNEPRLVMLSGGPAARVTCFPHGMLCPQENPPSAMQQQ